MQVRKFEAPTIQEALDTIKRELGPEAIILQTKKNKRGFGLMSRESVEVTAAVSDRSLQKKQFAEDRLPEGTRKSVKNLSADRQAEFLDQYSEKYARSKSAVHAYGRAPETKGESAPIDALLGAATSTRDRVEVNARRKASASEQVQAQSQAQAQAQARNSRSSVVTAANGSNLSSAGSKKLTATRYADIDEHEVSARIESTQAASLLNGPNASGPGSNAGGPVVTMAEEVRHLKRMIEEMKSSQDSVTGSGAQALMNNPPSGQSALASPALQDAYEQLVINGIDKRYAYQMMKEVSFELGEARAKNPDEVLDQLAFELMKSTEIDSPLANVVSRADASAERPKQGPVIIALVGPTGVGKTTTVAKMASEALLSRNLKVGLINLDSYKVAAFDQLGTYAKILNVPFRSCATGEDLRAAIQDFQSLDLVLVDTTGRSQRDPESLREMQAILNHVGQSSDLRTQLVLSVTTRDNELYDMASRFSLFRPQGIIVSKLDEASTYGSIYNVVQKVKLPLLYFTTGQRVPEDIEEASRERVAALILDL